MRHYRSTEYTQFTSLFFALISSLKTRWINLPNLLAVKHRQNKLPNSSAIPARGIGTRFSLARIRCDSNSRYWLAIVTPLPCSGFPGRSRPTIPSPPSPTPAPCDGGRGGGGGESTRPARASQAGTFPFILLTWSIYMFCMIDNIRILHRAD